MTATAAGTSDLDAAARRVDNAMERVGMLDPSSQTVANDLRAAIEGFHREGLVRIVRALKADSRGKELLFELVDDPVVYALLVMHGIVRADPTTMAQQALDGVRPYLASHGGGVELVSVDPPLARVRLSGACTGCSQSATTLREVVERALVASAAGVHEVQVLPSDPTPTVIGLSEITVRAGGTERGLSGTTTGAGDGAMGAGGWVEGPAMFTLADGRVTVWRAPGDDPESAGVAVVRIGERVSAYRDVCAHAGLTLENALVDAEGGTLRCSWHGMTYDAFSGESMSMPGKRLDAYPARVAGGVVWLRL